MKTLHLKCLPSLVSITDANSNMLAVDEYNTTLASKGNASFVQSVGGMISNVRIASYVDKYVEDNNYVRGNCGAAL
jgi:hypothetical protein